MPVPLSGYLEVPLTSELYAELSPHEQAMLPLLIDAAQEMDAIFWQEAYGDPAALLASIAAPEQRRLVEINCGPWDRADGNAPFIDGVHPKPPGAEFYPSDITPEEFEAACRASSDDGAALKSPYTLVKRDAHGELFAVPYHEAFGAHVGRAAEKLREAAELSEDPGLRRYLHLRAAALLDDDYRESDLAWLDMQDNGIDIIIGPVEQYEDALFGYKAAHEGVILLKDEAWSARLGSLEALMRDLQRQLPVPDAYKREMPGGEGDLGVYDAVWLAGDARVTRFAAVNLPNDEDVQLAKGTRQIQVRNVMQAAFDARNRARAGLVCTPEQLPRYTFDAYFQRILLHEVAHGLGVKHTLDSARTVRDALAEVHPAVEEAKADSLGLHLIGTLQEIGELPDADLEASLVTFLVHVLGIALTGTSEAHARGGLAEFAFLSDRGVFSRDPTSGRYRVEPSAIREGVALLAEKLLRLQGDGDYEAAIAFLATADAVHEALREDLDRLASADIPRELIFRQGMDVLRAGAATLVA